MATRHATRRDSNHNVASQLQEWGRSKREGFAALNLLAAQVVAAASRVLGGDKLDEIDNGAIGRAIDFYISQAAVIRYVERGGNGPAPKKLASFGLGSDILLEKQPRSEDPEHTAQSFERVASDLKEFKAHQDVARAKRIYRRFGQLARAARAQAGSAGHRRSSVGLPNF
jgi:hypothetical protein